MVSRKLTWSLLLVALLFSVPGFAVAARGQEVAPEVTRDQARSRGCSQATLEGTYGGFMQGTGLSSFGVGLLTPPYPLAFVGLDTFDGHGNVSTKVAASFDGLIFPWGTTATGTYNVSPDCMVSLEAKSSGSPTAHFAGTITGEGMSQEVHLVHTDPYWVTSGTLRKIPPRGCSQKTLDGTYAVFGQGTYTGVPAPTPGFPPPPVPAAHVGILTADGAGHFSGEGVEHLDSMAAPATYTATYTVSRDCRVSITIIGFTGLVMHETGTITGWGESQEFHTIITDPGWVFVDTAKRQ